MAAAVGSNDLRLYVEASAANHDTIAMVVPAPTVWSLQCTQRKKKLFHLGGPRGQRLLILKYRDRDQRSALPLVDPSEGSVTSGLNSILARPLDDRKGLSTSRTTASQPTRKPKAPHFKARLSHVEAWISKSYHGVSIEH